jgi:selenocysteine-specific elongation factor
MTGILNLSDGEMKRLVENLERGKILFQDDGACLYHRDHLESLQKKMLKIVREYHQQSPLRAGINKEELFIRTETGVGLFHPVLFLMIQEVYYLHQQSWGLVHKSLAQYFEKNDILTPRDLRGLFGLSRKFSIPLLEFLDSRKLTIRTGEGRILWKEGAM